MTTKLTEKLKQTFRSNTLIISLLNATMTAIELITIFDNEDIIRHICSFGYPEYRGLIAGIGKQITTNNQALDLHFDIVWEFNYSRFNSLGHYISVTYDKPSILKLHKRYKMCHCCTKHAYYKPDILKKNYNSKPVECYYSDTHPKCLCKCRHMARHAYKAYMIAEAVE